MREFRSFDFWTFRLTFQERRFTRQGRFLFDVFDCGFRTHNWDLSPECVFGGRIMKRE